MTAANTDTSAASRGFDSPVASRQDDHLNRWPLAREIFGIATTGPKAWSVRVGIYGEWGTGKTSVLRFVDSMASQAGHIVIWFDPWEHSTKHDLWQAFVLTVFDHLERKLGQVPGADQAKRKAWMDKAKGIVGAIAGIANDKAGKALDIGLNLVRKHFDFSPEDLASLQSILGDRRVIVLIDDLDRTAGDPFAKSGISVSFPSDLVPAGVTKEASLVVYDRQFAEYASNKYLSAGAQGIKLNINTTSILPEKRIRITVPYSGSFDPDSTYFIVEDQGIYPFVLDASLSNGILTGDLDSTWLVFLASRGISDANLNIVVMTKKPGAENDTAYTSSVQFWDDKNKTFTSLPSNLDLSGKKVCMVVHGLASKLADMVNLAGALAPAKNGEGKIAYDIVLGYEYGMLASIPTQGKDMAEKYLALKGARTTTRLDIFAHSMGNLVSRWAMQRPDKAGQTDFANSRIGQYVRNYVSLGGPHEGVPFKGAKWVLEGIKLALAQVGWPWFDCLNDLMCQGTPPKSSPEVLPWEPSSTVGMLNYNSNPNGKGPDFDSKDFKITTISGNVWDSYGVMGAAFATGYWFVFTNKQLDKLLEDGIVATYSAQGNELRKISSSVENIPTWKMNHGQMYNETTALKDIQGLVKRPGW